MTEKTETSLRVQAYRDEFDRLSAIAEPAIRFIFRDTIAKLEALGDLSCPPQSQKASP